MSDEITSCDILGVGVRKHHKQKVTQAERPFFRAGKPSLQIFTVDTLQEVPDPVPYTPPPRGYMLPFWSLLHVVLLTPRWLR